MSERYDEQRLEDYVDELLSETEAAAVERLLEASAEARATVDFLKELRERAAALPPEIEPPRDLWPAIETRMAPAPLAAVDTPAGTSDGAPSRRPANGVTWSLLQPRHWAALAAAAMVLIAVSSGLTAWMIGGPDAGSTPGTVGAVPVVAGGDVLRPIEAEYALEIERLLTMLYENREELDPDTVTTIETNLRVIDRAINRAREALGEDPANADLSRMVANGYRNKLQLLRRANRIIELS